MIPDYVRERTSKAAVYALRRFLRDWSPVRPYEIRAVMDQGIVADWDCSGGEPEAYWVTTAWDPWGDPEFLEVNTEDSSTRVNHPYTRDFDAALREGGCISRRERYGKAENR